MKIEIKQENYKQLVQCVYLGNLVINGYRKVGEEKEEYLQFTQNLLSQFAAAMPYKSGYKFLHMPNEKSDDARLSDLNNLIDESVKEFYTQHLKDAFCEIFDCVY